MLIVSLFNIVLVVVLEKFTTEDTESTEKAKV